MRAINPYSILPPEPVIFRTEFDRLLELPEIVEAQLTVVVEKYAFLIKALAQWYVPVDQGAAKASIYVVTPTISGKEEAYSQAKEYAKLHESKHGHKGREVEFAMDDSAEDSVKKIHALICVGVIYGMWLELGEYNIQATNPGATHPYLTPAVMHYEQSFFNDCRKIIEQVKL